MTEPRRHKIILDARFDRPIRLKRALLLLEDAINRNVCAMGRDLTRPKEPEVRLTRVRAMHVSKVLAAEMIKKRDARRAEYEKLKKEFGDG